MSAPRLRLAVLGSIGSIGVNTLDVAARHPERFDVVALTAATQVEQGSAAIEAVARDAGVKVRAAMA
jgi:1-deoxy-D-xylulose 5-phosphate reductoisomerase